MKMNIGYGQPPGIVSKGKPLRENHKQIQSLVIESGNRIQPEDIVKLTGWYYLSVLNVSKVREDNVVRSEAIAHNVVHAHKGGMIT
ncbi:MAG: hypothetical protein HXS48_09410 [Theionarchaea archaeon]|nr:hypothetical protein [Theionarchaea archaeon]